MASIPLSMHRFKDSDDIEYYFQRELDKFPRLDLENQERPIFAEFGALMIRPLDEPRNKLTHLVFPETLLALPYVEDSVRGFSHRTFTQTMLMSGDDNTLYVKLTADRITEEGFIRREELILSTRDVFFIPNLWSMVADRDREILATFGFGPETSHHEWAILIDKIKEKTTPKRYPSSNNGDFIFARELDTAINIKGAVGNSGSYHFMPEFVAGVLENNQFVFDDMERNKVEADVPYEIGEVHVHPTGNKMSPLQQAVANVVGEDIVRGVPSIPDIAILRSSTYGHSEISKAFRGRDTNTMESFIGIVVVDQDGKVTGSRYVDLGDADMEYLRDLNDKAEESLESSSPDVSIIADHYLYIDSLAKDSFGTPDNSDHIGDPDFDRLAVSK